MKTGILLVDDDDGFRTEFAALLRQAGYRVIEARDREEGYALWQEHGDLTIALVDLDMPDREYPSKESGKVLIGDLTGSRPGATIAAITAFDGHDHLVKVAHAGADGFVSKADPVHRWLAHVSLWTRVTGTQSAFAAYLGSLELRNPYTAGHCHRVREFARATIPYLPRAVTGQSFDLASCLIGAEVHDLGKIGTPDAILLGTRPELTLEERETMGRHPVRGARMLLAMGQGFERVADIALLHHRWFAEPEGLEPSDYPRGGVDGEDTRRGNEIPLEVRIVAVADALDAMLSDRSYRPGKPLEEALGILDKEKGDHFCPTAVDALLKVDKARLIEISQEHAPALEAKLTLVFEERKMTPNRLMTLSSPLRDVYLPDGCAADRLAVVDVVGPDPAQERPAVIYLRGTEEDVKGTFAVLRSRMQQHEGMIARFKTMRKSGEEIPDSMLMGMSRAVPSAIEWSNRTGTETETFPEREDVPESPAP